MKVMDLYAKLDARFKNAEGYLFRTDRGLIRIDGPDHIKFLHTLTTNDVKGASVDSFLKACFLTAKGKILNECHLIFFPDHVFLETSLIQVPMVLETLGKYRLASRVTFEDISKSQVQVVQFGTSHGEGYRHMTFPESTTLFMKREDANTLQAKLIENENTFFLEENLYEKIRIHFGIPLFGKDFVSDEIIIKEIPYFDDAVSYTKGCYPGQEVVARLHSRGDNVAHRLMGVQVFGARDPVGADIFKDDQCVGKITSTVRLENKNDFLGLARLHRQAFAPGTNVFIKSSDKTSQEEVIEGCVVSLPAY